MVIQHNLSAMNADREYKITTGRRAKTQEKLSSGYRINRAADDAAGLAISEKMRREIRGLTQGSRNIQEGISLVQTADGYLAEVHDMIQRVNELAVKGANDTMTDEDRSYLDKEVQAMKTEMKRIFDSATYNENLIFRVPYMPEVSVAPEPYDIQLFYSNSGQIGGLEFNNVRYSIEELRNIPEDRGGSLKLDDNGIATEDQVVSFKLNYPEDEEVTLKLSKGESLKDVKREYSWEAKNDGIYVNNVFATSWEDMGIDTAGPNKKGVRSFNYHGMNVAFEVEEGDTVSEIKKGINGDNFTTPATWDISVAGATTKYVAPIVDSIGDNKNVSTTKITVSSANKDYINDTYQISADEDGLAIEWQGEDGIVHTTDRTSWSSFSNVIGPPDYPIVDWGLDNDWGTDHPNDSSEVKFDGSAVYHYESPDSNVPIQYYFQIAESASQEEVLRTLNGQEIDGNIVCPTNTTSSNASLRIYNKQIDGSSTGDNDRAFELQNLYGRTFDSSSETLTGDVTWTKVIVSGKPDDGTLTPSKSATRTTGTSDSTSGVSNYYKVQVGTEGNPTYRYYQVEGTSHDITRNKQYTNTYSWNETMRLDYTGRFNGDDMVGFSGPNVTMDLNRVDTVSFTTNEKYTLYASVTEITDTTGLDTDSMEVLTESDAGQRYKTDGTRYDVQAETSSAETTTTGSVNVVNRNNIYLNGSDFVKEGVSADDYAFKFEHTISYQNLYNMADRSSASSTIKTQATGEAYRSFTPGGNGQRLSEPDFMSIVVNPPEKHCIIQCASEATDPYEIDIKWDALNLSVLGLSGADLTSGSRCMSTIELAKNALGVISRSRMVFGTYQNRLEHTMRYTDNTMENTQAAESIIRDTDMAKEMSAFTNTDVIAQAGQMVLAQANQTKQGVLSLLQ
jgi:flagellin-like hook-associated protein FlgL